MDIVFYLTNIGAPLILGHWKFATDKPLTLQVYQWQTSPDLGLRSYICRIHLAAMVYMYISYTQTLC